MTIASERPAWWDRIVAAAASRRLATAVIVSWLLVIAVWIVPFEFYGLPASRIQAIVRDELFLRVVYGLLLGSSLACILARLPRLWRRAWRVPDVTRAAAARTGTTVGAPYRDGAAEKALVAAGYARTVATDEWAWGVRRPWAVLGTAVFHLSFLVVAAGVALYVAPLGVFDAKAAVAEGETFTGQPASYVERSTASSAYPDVSFTLRNLSASFYRDILLFTRLAATIDTSGGTRSVTLSAPWFASASTLVMIQDFGYAPEFAISASDDPTPSVNVYKLKVFPSGLSDSFEADVGKGNIRRYDVKVQVYGDYVDRDGKPGVRSFNLADPRLVIGIDRRLETGVAKPMVAGRLARVGETVSVPGLDLKLTAVRQYGVFRVVSSPGIPVVLIGLAIAAVGTVTRLLLPRREALIRSAEGGCLISVVTDVYGRTPSREARLAEAYREAGS